MFLDFQRRPTSIAEPAKLPGRVVYEAAHPGPYPAPGGFKVIVEPRVRSPAVWPEVPEQ